MKKILLTSVLAVSFLMPASEVKAQGWPTFDVAKLASLVTNLVGRFQPVPQVLSRVNQVKTTMAQIQAVGQAALSGDLKAIGQQAAGALMSGAFSTVTSGVSNDMSKAAEGDNGATNASKKAEDTMFAPKNKEYSMEERSETLNARKEYQRQASEELISTSFYMAVNAPKQSEERFKKADEAMKNAETLQDAINANTMMIMNGNYERLNQIALKLASLKSDTATRLGELPSDGYKKPKPIKGLKMGLGEFSVEEKDEIDVDFE